MKISHIITSLSQGGAEGALVRLVCESKYPAAHTVISLSDEGIHGATLRAYGARVISMGAPSGSFSLSAFCRLVAEIKGSSPDVVQTWMYHSDLLGGLAAKQLGIPAVWGVRMSNNELHYLGFKTWIVAKACALLSRVIPRSIISCSHRSIETHRKFGYAGNFNYIPNGFPIPVSVIDSVIHSVPVFGHAARLHPLKGHAVFLRALELLKEKHVDFQVKMAGTGISCINPNFSAILPLSVIENTVAIGPQSDMPAFYAGCDVFVLSSLGEAFPNVVAEAMLAGLPCIVTDVGDAAEIVGNTGWVVPANNPEALAEAMHQAVMALADVEAWATRRAAARARIVAEYSMEKMQARFEAAWIAAIEK